MTLPHLHRLETGRRAESVTSVDLEMQPLTGAKRETWGSSRAKRMFGVILWDAFFTDNLVVISRISMFLV